MPTIVGAGRFTYEVAEGWGEIPEGWKFTQVAGVAVDSQDRVFVFNRGEHPVVIFSRDGKFLKSWGEGTFTTAHGIYMGPDDSVYLVDTGDHTVRKFTADGKLLMTLGTKDQPGENGRPFDRPTGVALSPSGEIYVSDGYGNRRMHKFSPDGKLLLSWGEEGEGIGQFALPHGVFVDRQDRVFVADRENHRIQIFTSEAEFITQWTDFREHKPCTLFIDGDSLAPGLLTSCWMESFWPAGVRMIQPTSPATSSPRTRPALIRTAISTSVRCWRVRGFRNSSA